MLCEKHALSKIHPDLATSGGILETHKIGNMAEEYGVPQWDQERSWDRLWS